MDSNDNTGVLNHEPNQNEVGVKYIFFFLCKFTFTVNVSYDKYNKFGFH